MNDSFFSIVEDEASGGKNLKVRTRRRGDLEKLIGQNPSILIERTPNRDYLYRMHLPRDVVGELIGAHVRHINYTNFKGSVKESGLHDAYFAIWGRLRAEDDRGFE